MHMWKEAWYNFDDIYNVGSLQRYNRQNDEGKEYFLLGIEHLDQIDHLSLTFASM